MIAIEIDQLPQNQIRFSICTLVNNREEYSEMINSFKNAGFTESLCEFLYIDNSKNNKFDAYEGLNKLITVSRGEYIILCHQDIELRFDNIEVLNKRLAELHKLDKNWGIASNAGGYNIKKLVQRISHSFEQHNMGPFPHIVKSVDENFIVIKKSANLSFSRNLKGFHLYGTDLCIIANILGYNAWAIDFHIFHKSTGNMNNSFYEARQNLIQKYSNAFKSRYIRSTCTIMYISNNKISRALNNTPIMISIAKFILKTKKALGIDDGKHK